MSSERRYMVLTAVGPDRPGIVQEISSAIHEAALNLEDSRMAILGGEFALILLFSGPSESVERMRDRAASLEARLGLRISLHDTKKSSAPRSFQAYQLRASGVDRPGIVVAISKVLAGRSINVSSFESRVQNAPESGTPIFQLRAEIQVPSEVAPASLQADLAATCEDESLDFALEPA